MIAWTIVSVLVAIFLFISLKPFNYWAKRGAKRSSIFQSWIDNFRAFFQLTSMAEHVAELCKRFEDERYFGAALFFSPSLYIHDPDLIKQITVKDFENFMDHFQFASEDHEPLWAKGLFLLKGDRWRSMRSTLSPSFTSSKMKGMFDLMKENAENFVRFYEKRPSMAEVVDLKDAFARYANDVIASAAFGVGCDSLVDRENEFYLMGKKATDLSGFWKSMTFVVLFFSPSLAKLLGLRILPEDADRFFRRLVKDTMETRKRNGIVRPDMIHLLMEARKGKLKYEENPEVDAGFATAEEFSIGKPENHLALTDEDITAQALIFFFAGFDTTSTLMSFMAYELAVNPDVQESLQTEIDDTLHQCQGSVTYEALFKMKYLDMVVSETLRKWPSVNLIDRICVKNYVIEPKKHEENPITIKKGDFLSIPVYAMHRDPKYYPNPKKFDPLRFSDENKSKILPYTYLTFGSGPRSCIGSRFALLETKILFFTLLSKFDIVVVEKTEIPLTLSKKHFDLAAANGVWAGFRSRKIERQLTTKKSM